jgi:hypothetical protein
MEIKENVNCMIFEKKDGTYGEFLGCSNYRKPGNRFYENDSEI